MTKSLGVILLCGIEQSAVRRLIMNDSHWLHDLVQHYTLPCTCTRVLHLCVPLHCYHREIRKSLSHRLILGMCLSILLLLVSFLLGVSRTVVTSSNTACYVMALITHYLLLCTFGWTSVVATHLYHRLVNVFGEFSTKKVKFMLLAVFGE